MSWGSWRTASMESCATDKSCGSGNSVKVWWEKSTFSGGTVRGRDTSGVAESTHLRHVTPPLPLRCFLHRLLLGSNTNWPEHDPVAEESGFRSRVGGGSLWKSEFFVAHWLH